MNLTVDQVINWLATITISAIGIWNLFTIRKRNRSLDKVDEVSNIKSLNESVALANTRALHAEKLYVDEKAYFEEETKKQEAGRAKVEEDMFLLTQRIKTLEVELEEKYSLPYRIVFDVRLGKDPFIDGASITHIKERRKEEIPVLVDRRKNI